MLSRPAWVLGLFAVTGLFATALARVFAFVGVNRVGASVNSAGVNTRPVWAMLLAVLVLGERVTPQIIVGIGLVVVDLIALAFSESGDVTGWRLRDLAFPLAAALTFVGGNVARRFGLTAAVVTPLEAVEINETAGLIGLLAYVAARRRGDMRAFLTAPRRA